MGFYLAIDNGGTKADYVLADDNTVLAKARTGTLKRLRVDAATAALHLHTGLAELTAQCGIAMSQVTRTCIGTAGEQVALVANWLRVEVPARVAGEFLLLGDVEIALDAAFRGGPGVLVLAGTGSNVAGRGTDGVITTAGGWGPVLAEQGSGYRIGIEALRAVFLAIDEGVATSLLDAVLAFWHLADRDALVGYANRTPAPDFSRLTELVVSAAAAGDEVARSVLHQQGRELAHLVRLVLRRLGAAELQLAFAGSIMEKVAPVREALVAAVQAEFPGVRPLPGVVDPIEGALYRARRGSHLSS